MILGSGRPSTTDTRMLPGLRSRWITPFWCACCTPSQTRMKSSRRSRSGSDCCSQKLVSGLPSMNSIAKKGKPSGVAPASYTWAMAGCFICASNWRSTSK
ncbi:MAG: hypothetical protein A2X76_09180 [Lysobacterales bacterium GWF1_69_6]|nr:MAG: hypothetical protein A2X76_09180 [Xanthomonadales bacterium GWF1_69_6]